MFGLTQVCSCRVTKGRVFVYESFTEDIDIEEWLTGKGVHERARPG